MKKLKIKQLILSIILSVYYAIGTSYCLNVGIYGNSILSKLLFTIILLPLFYLLLDFFNKKTLRREKKEKTIRREVFVYFIIIILVLLFYFIIYYPGGSTFDTMTQWNQVQNNVYDDWHPVMHTLVFFKLPSLIWNNLAACTLFQILFISIIITYMFYVLRKLGISQKKCLLLLALLILNPSFGRMGIMLWKDIPFSYTVLLTTVLLIQVYYSKGFFLKKKGNIIIFVAGCLGLIFFRHNGITCFLGMMFFLIIFYNKQRKLLITIAISILAFQYLLTGYGYPLLNIGKHSATFLEIIGVPLNQISYIYNNDGEINVKELEVMNNIVPLEDWEEYYLIDSFNNVKWNGQINYSYIDNNNKEILLLWLDLVKKNPQMAIKSYYHVTSAIWKIEYQNFGIHSENKNTEESKYPILVHCFNDVNDTVNNYELWMSKSIVGRVLFSIGGSLFIIIFSIILLFNKQKTNWRKLIPFIPAIVNTITIMLLLTGREIRFVYSNILCALPLLCFVLIKEEKNEEII